MSNLKNWFQQKSPIIALVAITLLVVIAFTSTYIIQAFTEPNSVPAKQEQSIAEMRARQAVLDEALKDNKVEEDTTRKHLDVVVASWNAIRLERSDLDKKIIDAINAPLDSKNKTKQSVGLQ